MQGMQVNPGVRTIEAEIHKALVEAQAISTCAETNNSKKTGKDTVTDDFRRCKWGRAARTDKGVSAAGQVVAFNMTFRPDITSRLNATLPDQLLVYGLKCAPSPLSDSSGQPLLGWMLGKASLCMC
jgi:tRNA pseudouridine38-40 synthase